MARSRTPKFDASEVITNEIIRIIERGVLPWRKPWTAGGSSRPLRVGGEAAFLPDERLQQGAPLNWGEAGAPHACKAAGLLGHADDELLDIFCRIPEHLCAAGIGIDLTRAINAARISTRCSPTACRSMR